MIFPGDHSDFVLWSDFADNAAITGKVRKAQQSSGIGEEKLGKEMQEPFLGSHFIASGRG